MNPYTIHGRQAGFLRNIGVHMSTNANRPTGTVTFLFTDIVGSTTIAREHRDEWEALRARHHAILRSAAEAHNGYVFKDIGDAFCVAFPGPRDAVSAAVAAQRGLETEPWREVIIRVRMGIHTGEAELDGADYRGYLTLSFTQRVMHIAHGGQVLLSRTAFDLVEDQLPEGIGLRDLGEHRLKDLSRPEHLYQLVVADLPCEFAPLQSLDARPNNLPIQLTSFIGRDKDITAVSEMLQHSRLVTLSGVGGTGKTRLALQAAAHVLEHYVDGAWFVELAPISDPSLLPQTIAAALRVPEQPGRPFLQLLKDVLGPKNLLLLLDNCEHLIDTCSEAAEVLLKAAPEVRILATSREALGIAGECIFPVRSMMLPPGSIPSAAAVLQSDAGQLFVERAVAVQPDFRLTDEKAAAVTQICARLDGIPLAIELAAARVKGLSIEQIASRLDDRFRLLTGGSRTALPRQRTLQAAIDWSYRLLSEEERALLSGLSVFAGGWTLEASESVCASGSRKSTPVLDLQSRLIDKSLVIADTQSGEPRYRMLETIRQYARDRLLNTQRDFERVMSRHLEYFIGWSEEANLQLRGANQREWLGRMELESDNLRLALEWSMKPEQDPDLGLRLLAAALWFWWLHGHYSEAKHWIERILGRSSSRRSLAMAHVLSWAGIFLSGQPDQIKRAQAYLEDSLRIGLEHQDKASISWALMMLARLAENQGDSVNAVAFGEQALQASRELGETWYICFALERLGEALRLAGDYDRSKRLYEESLELARRMGTQREIAVLLHNLGHVLLQQGNLEESFSRFWASLQLAKEIGEERRIIMCLEGIAGVFVQAGKLEQAARLFGATANLRGVLGADFEPADHIVYLRNAAFLQPQELETAWAEGRAMTMEQAIVWALENSRA